MTWTITEHGLNSNGNYEYTVSALTTLPSFNFIAPPVAVAERQALYGESLAVGCMAGEHLMRLHGWEGDMPTAVSDKLIEVHGSLDALRIKPYWFGADAAHRNNAGSITLNWGTSGTQTEQIVPGRTLLLAFISLSSTLASTVATPSGWTYLRDDERVGAKRIRTYVFWRWAPDPLPGSLNTSFVSSGATIDGMIGTLHIFNQANRVSPFTHAASTGTAVDPAAPSVTTPVERCVVIANLAHDHGVGGFSHSPAGDQFEAVDFETSGAGSRVSLADQIKEYAAAGATGTLVFDCTQTVTADYVAHRVAIRP